MIYEGQGPIEKLETGIPGFEVVSQGGIPKGRTTLVAGTAGSGKTVFAAQFLAGGIMRFGEPGVFVTFEDPPPDICSNMAGFGWDIEGWQRQGKWAFVDATPEPGEQIVVLGSYDLGGLLARIENAVRKTGARRVSLDSLGALFSQLDDRGILRMELSRMTAALKAMGVTAILTAERTQDYGDIARYGLEEFVADNVIVLRNSLVQERRRRTLEILKFRGTYHQKGEFPFSIDPREGIIVIPLSAIQLKQKSSNKRISSGNEGLDAMCGGGFFIDSIVLVSGATGTGKTLTASSFVGSAAGDEKSVLFAFEESRDQLVRNAAGWGLDLAGMEAAGRLMIVPEYPHAYGLEDHLIRMKQVIDDFRPNRVALDSLSALERISSVKGFREFVIGVTSYLKLHEIGGLLTASTPTLAGGDSVTESHVSTFTDSIILLRYVEMFGEMRRGLTVLKMRGSMHDKDIREYTIDSTGMRIGKPFRSVTGILAGNPAHVAPAELERLGMLFSDDDEPLDRS